MNTTILFTLFRTVIGFAFSLLMLGSFSNLAAQANVPLTGVFAARNWQVRLDEKSGTGVFTAVGSGSRKIGETFLKVSRRSSYNSWRGRAFGKTFSNVMQSVISINGDTLSVTPKTGPAYFLIRVLPAGSSARRAISSSGTLPDGYSAPKKSYPAPASASGRTGSGCSTVQCSGTTHTGRRCRRTTTNCSGRCWQH